MDRLSQLRNEAGSSRDCTLDASTSSEAYMTANESSSKYFSLTEENSTFNLSPIRDVSLASTADAEKPNIGSEISNLSPISKKNDLLDSYKFGNQIEAANILSGGVNIFDENSGDHDELVIDDNVMDIGDKCDPELTVNENPGLPFQKEDGVGMAGDTSNAPVVVVASKGTQVVLNIDGKTVNAINIGTGLYLFRKEDQEELAAVQIIDDEQSQPSFKYLKVREIPDDKLEVYEEIKVEVPKETPLKEVRNMEMNLPVDEEAIVDPKAKKLGAKTQLFPKDTLPVVATNECVDKQVAIEVKTESLNSKMAKFNENKKSPIIRSTPNKEGIPLTKTMVDEKLHSHRQWDKVKTIEIHTDNTRQKLTDTPTKIKDIADCEVNKIPDISPDPVKAHEKLIPEIKGKASTGKIEDEKIVEKSTTHEVSNIEGNLLEQSKTSGYDDQQPEAAKLECKKNFEMSQKNLVNVSGNIQPKNIQDEALTESGNINSSDREIAGSSNLDKQFGKEIYDRGDKQKLDNSQKVSKSTLSQTIKESINAIVDKINNIPDIATDERKQVNKEPVLSIQITPKEGCSLKDVVYPDITNERGISSPTKTNLTEEFTIETTQLKDVDRSFKTVDPIKSSNEPGRLTPQKLKTGQDLIPPSQSDYTKLTKSVEPVSHKNNIEDTKPTLVIVGDVNSSNTPVSQKNTQCVPKEEISMKSNTFNPGDKEQTKFQQQGTSTPKVVENTSQVLPISLQDQYKNTTMSKQDLTSPQYHTAPKYHTKPKDIDKEKRITLLSDKHHKMLNLEEDIKELSRPVIGSAVSTAINKCGDTKFIHENKIECTSKTNIPQSSVKPATFSQKLDALKAYPKQTVANVEAKSLPNKSDIQFTSAPTSTAPKPVLQNKSSEHRQDIKIDASKVVSTRTNIMPVIVRSLPDTKVNLKKETANVSSSLEKKPYNNNHTAVPFGKWTEANRQEFLNKIKESKVPSTMANTKQIKQPNDLNKREFLQKIDIYRNPASNTTVKCNEQKVAARLDVRTDTKTYKIKPTASRDPQVPVKYDTSVKSNVLAGTKQNKVLTKPDVPKPPIKAVTTVGAATNQDPHQIRNNQDLIDKTIEGIINRVITAKPEELLPNVSNDKKKETKVSSFRTQDHLPKDKHPASLDALEMKMNELHGIPFVERPPHQLPKPYNLDIKTYSKAESLQNTSKVQVPKASSLKSQIPQKISTQNFKDIDSEEEVIEHRPITGDIDLSKSCILPKISTKLSVTVTSEASKSDAIITETDFDKFARRNSFTYENRLTVKFEGNESHQVVQTIVEKEPPQVKKYSRNELLLAEAKVKSDQKQLNRNNHPVKSQAASKMHVSDDTSNRNYQSKLQIAYQSALTAKRKTEPPITIIEDKPVKVLFVDTSTEFTPSQLNVQGKQLSPVKKKNMPESDAVTVSPGNSIDSNVLDSKQQDDNKVKIKHQRKQVLTPVEMPELELIEPRDYDLAVSPKKKRKTEEVALDKSPKNVVPKKSYLLGRNTVVEETESTPQDLIITKNLRSNVVTHNAIVTHKDTASAIDNLVKAAELLETQSEKLKSNISVNSDNSGCQASPAKRGRGRPRKYPLGDGPQISNKVSSPEIKSEFINATPPKHGNSDDDISDDEMVTENWTMGKINENIVCPICKKLFRSENVVFKHVKHCTGPSPNRSESDKQSRRSRQSQESETKSVESKIEDIDYEPPAQRKQKKITPKKRKSKDAMSDSSIEKDDLIVIENTPKDKPSQHASRISSKTKIFSQGTLACDICGKTFRQLSYLVSHKWQHKRDESKKNDNKITEITKKNVFRCEVCKKQFRKLHHLVQHRLIHNPSSAPTRSSRKSSSEQIENKMRDRDLSKPVEDPSAAFRCEPCDKSFRKLHHLVEHRETHDGQNRQKNVQLNQTPEEKVVSEPPPQCDICKKTFRKLHHLIEHKELHLETSSEKSDDKSIKSSLSTKDIIHECRLCYMVFPNEHSLNKHSVFCQRKKKQKAAKLEDKEMADVNVEVQETIEQEVIDVAEKVAEEKHVENKELAAELSKPDVSSVDVVEAPEKDIPKEIVVEFIDSSAATVSVQKDDEVVATGKDEVVQATPEIKKIEDSTKEVVIFKAVPRRKTLVKDKKSPLVNKRQKTNALPVSGDVTVPESSDDDEARYMLNPDYKSKQSMLFMEVRTKKRSSLQIEKPNKDSVKRRASDSVKRRTSLHNPPKIPQLESKSIVTKVMKTAAMTKSVTKITKTELVPSTDSDDSDIKYAFPETIVEKPKDTEIKKVKQENTVAKIATQVKRKSIAGKRKSLSGIAKRKSVGKPALHNKKKEKEKMQELVKVIKRRTLGVEHRCDCGQLFGSAALLARHTTLAHTPPRIRRRRSPPPPPAPLASSNTAPHTSNSRKSSVKSDQPKPTTKSTGKSEKADISSRKILKSTEKQDSSGSKTAVKSRPAHKGVPLPEKMKKLIDKH